MAWEFDSATPLYAQLASRVRADIVCGVYKKGDKLPAVRELALAEARERIASFLVADFARKITGLGYSLHDGAQMVENFNISKEDNTDGNSGS